MADNNIVNFPEGINIGVDYYPEHWDEALWVKDADMMYDAGVKIVRMAEFAWCRLEPEEEKFDFEWLDRAVQLFGERDMYVILCTRQTHLRSGFLKSIPKLFRLTRRERKFRQG